MSELPEGQGLKGSGNMIRVFYGDDRLKIEAEIRRYLGEGYEVIEADTLAVVDLPTIFWGTSLLGGDERCILIKGLGENSACFERLPDYLNTPHRVALWEEKIDKRTVAYKTLSKYGVKMDEFRLAEAPEKKMVFDVFDLAWKRKGKEAVALCERIETTNDPYMFLGLLVSQVMKKLEVGGDLGRTRKVIKAMAEVDLKMKSSTVEPWVLIKMLVLEIAVL